MSPVPQSPSPTSLFKTSQASSPVDDLVLALYDFSANAPSTNRCLSFKAGQVIRVVNRDKSGWWDGEMILTSKSPLNTSFSSSSSTPPAIQRGWFPSNYVNSIPTSNIASYKLTQKPCQQRRPSVASLASSNTNDILLDSPVLSLDQTSLVDTHTPSHSPTGSGSTLASQNQPFTSGPTHAKSLWQPIALAIRTLHSQVHINSNFDVQPAIAKIISAVRAALDCTGCLSRHAPALKLYPNLSRARKLLLCSLSSLVDLARDITPSRSPSTAFQFSQQEAKETLLRLSDQVLTHICELLRIVHHCGITPNSPSYAKLNSSNNNNDTHADSLLMTSGQRSMSVSSPHPPHPLQPPGMIRPCKSVGTLAKIPSCQSTQRSSPLVDTNPSDHHDHDHHHQARWSSKRMTRCSPPSLSSSATRTCTP
ncbi:hypothetical protein VP01_2103g2 [Puccinia sorghi]|uniref:SH3 domain-containing protein n=1 Tax=Puccinia sorghi TaxID=27349 RepID=A0A0L6VAC7_9BASI|nr:hypothetical protein VP01_2103g2 [Puccinia sorghi]